MTLNPRERFSKSRISEALNRFRVEEKFRSTSFPNRPGPRRFEPHLVIAAGQTAIISTDHVVALIFRNHFQVLFPNVGEDPIASFLIEPLDLLRTTKKDPTQHQLRRALGMRFSISQR